MKKKNLRTTIMVFAILLSFAVGGVALAAGSTIQAKIKSIFASYRQKVKTDVRNEVLQEEPDTDLIEKKIEETRDAIEKEKADQIKKAKNDLSNIEKDKIKEVTSELDTQKSITVEEISDTVTQVKKEYEKTLDNRIEELMKEEFKSNSNKNNK